MLAASTHRFYSNERCLDACALVDPGAPAGGSCRRRWPSELLQRLVEATRVDVGTLAATLEDLRADKDLPEGQVKMPGIRLSSSACSCPNCLSPAGGRHAVRWVHST